MDEAVFFLTQHVSELLFWIVVGSGIIQIAPIKINPWDYLGKKIGQILNSEVILNVKRVESKVDIVEQQLEIHREENARDQANQSRYRVLRFNDEIIEGRRHTQEHFD